MYLGECQRQCDEQRHRGQHQAENHALWDAWTAARPQRPCAFCPQWTCVPSHHLTTLTCHMEHVRSLTYVDIHTGLHAVFRRQRKDRDDGGREVPPVCPSLALWEWQNDLLHSSRRGIRTHVLPYQHPCESSSVPFTHHNVVHAVRIYNSHFHHVFLCFLPLQVKPLIWIESVIEKFSHSRVEIMVKVSTLPWEAYFSNKGKKKWQPEPSYQ